MTEWELKSATVNDVCIHIIFLCCYIHINENIIKFPFICHIAKSFLIGILIHSFLSFHFCCYSRSRWNLTALRTWNLMHVTFSCDKSWLYPSCIENGCFCILSYVVRITTVYVYEYINICILMLIHKWAKWRRTDITWLLYHNQLST